VASQNAIVCRGTPDELLLAEKLINDLDKARAEVVVDIAVLEVSKNWEKTLGISWPSSVGIALQPPTSSTSSSSTTTTTGTTTSTTPTLYDLAHLKATDFAVTIGSATANLLLTDSHTKILQNPRIRATDAQKALLTIGERIPIATGSYQTGAATAVVSSLVNTQFQYQDVGVKVEMTPTVHYDHDVTLKIKIEVSSQSGSVTISGVTEPIIAQNIVDQVIRLREGEASILGGIQESQDQVSWTGIPGLSSIPILRYLFGSKDHTITDNELVFLVVPHIVRTQTLDRVNLRAIDTGVGNTSIDLRRVSSDGPGATGLSSAAAPASNGAPESASVLRGSAVVRPNVGMVPGQSAMAAAPAALAQLSASADANGDTAVAAVAGHSPSPPVAQKVSLMFSPLAGPVAAGSTFQVPIVLMGATDIASVPLQIQYDPAKLSLVNVSPGDLLSRDGQAVALVHRDDGAGSVNIVASRPPGAAGVAGAGVVCVLSFQAKAAGGRSTAPAAGAGPGRAAQHCGEVDDESRANETGTKETHSGESRPAKPAEPECPPPRARPHLGRVDRDRGDSIDSRFSGGAHCPLSGQAPKRAPVAARPVGDARRHRPLQGRSRHARLPDQGGQPELSARPGDAGERRGRAGQEGQVSAQDSGGPNDRQGRVGVALHARRPDVGLLRGAERFRCVFKVHGNGTGRHQIFHLVGGWRSWRG